METNPFKIIEKKIDGLKNCILEYSQQQSVPPKLESDQTFKYIPINDIFKSKLMSKPTFYNHVKTGRITLYKFGNKSFVDKSEFENSFSKVQISK